MRENKQFGGGLMKLQITRFVHVADDALDRDVADRFAEKQFLDCRRGNGAQGGQ